MYTAPEESKLEKWGNSTITFSYRSGVLAGATFHEHFINKGTPCNVTVTVSGLSTDTTMFVQSYERYSLYIYMVISSTGTTNSVISHISSDTDTLEIVANLPEYLGNVSYFTLTSDGIAEGDDTGIGGGFVASECDTTLVKNCSFYNNEKGEYLSVENDSTCIEIDLTGVEGNIISDPLFVNRRLTLYRWRHT